MVLYATNLTFNFIGNYVGKERKTNCFCLLFQTALKAKQKMLKEDWEFFKAQRKMLEEKVLKNMPSSQASTMAASSAGYSSTSATAGMIAQQANAAHKYVPFLLNLLFVAFLANW